MTTILGILILALGLSVVLTLLMIRVAIGFGVIDRPDLTRHLHGRAVPKLGGVAIFIAFALPLLLLMHMQNITIVSRLLLGEVVQVGGLLIGSAVILIMGVMDDILDLRPRWKIIWQIVGAAMAYYSGFSITALTLPFFGSFYLGSFSFAVTILWFLICMNAVNLLDGHDGLAAGACLFVGLTLLLVSITNNNMFGTLMMASFAGAVLGFLFFNFPPAKIFLGDSGSLVLGYLVAGLSLLGATMKAETAFSLLVPVVALGLPFFDTLFAVTRRVYRRMPISMGDRGHIHHVLGKMGYSSRRVVLTLYGVTIALCVLAFVITISRNEIVLVVILVLVAVAFVTVRLFSGITPEQFVGRYIADKSFSRKVLKSRLVLENSIDGLQQASSVREVWEQCSGILTDVGVARVSFHYKEGEESVLMVGPGAANISESASGDWNISVPLLRKENLLGKIDVELHESEHSLAALPEFMGLLERIREILADAIISLPHDQVNGRYSLAGADELKDIPADAELGHLASQLPRGAGASGEKRIS